MSMKRKKGMIIELVNNNIPCVSFFSFRCFCVCFLLSQVVQCFIHGDIS